ncbi:tRNA (adenine(22)-N(1))-methyltransferase TrmK [Niallia sp.]|uniref:tRNA (adenine(22)-N(1))-methyltransferase n=1 Tax=Niallia sp. TaxID=2837523 RepID=UPI002896CB76|nr:tRNA (adenine(22)-N(1))-methyltransferase TrmK [Niallia sp.]
MNTDKLSKRLETVAKYIPKNAKFADIGSDHAYLPCYMVKKSDVRFAIAGEVVEGPFQSAVKQVKQEGFTSKISVRKGNGLEVIEPNEVDCITIAGMGGTLIATILENGKAKLGAVQRLILQPNISASSIREWLLTNGWTLIAEEILEEDGKIYEVLVAEKGNPYSLYKANKESALLFGPFLMREKNTAFVKKWTIEKKNWQRILTQLESAPESVENSLKRKELQGKIKLVDEVIKNEEY